jgi:hypothetical protein
MATAAAFVCVGAEYSLPPDLDPEPKPATPAVISASRVSGSTA